MAANNPPEEGREKEPFPWHLGIYDAHCHPTDTRASIDHIPSMKTRALTIMATRGQDQDIVGEFAAKLGATMEDAMNIDSGRQDQRRSIFPAFGWHPWFSHQIYDDLSSATSEKEGHYNNVIVPQPNDDNFISSLLEPRSLSGLLNQIRAHLEQYPLGLVGEIGLDRAFRIPETESRDDNNSAQRSPSLTPGGRDGKRLSPYRVDIEHQRTILKAQLNLAGEMQRAVSVHGVAAHGIVYDTLRETWRGHEKPVLSKRSRKRRASVDKAHENDDTGVEKIGATRNGISPKPYPPRICLHSYSGPPDTLRQYLHPSVPARIFFSFSCLVNFSSPSSSSSSPPSLMPKKTVEVVKAVPDDRILAESDLHAAGERMDELMEEVVRKICSIKGWQLEYGVRQLAANWRCFVLGTDETT